MQSRFEISFTPLLDAVRCFPNSLPASGDRYECRMLICSGGQGYGFVTPNLLGRNVSSFQTSCNLFEGLRDDHINAFPNAQPLNKETPLSLKS